MKFKFVGGSLDGDEQEIDPRTNYRIRIAHPLERDFWKSPTLHVDDEKLYLAEIYEVIDPSRLEYHFVGYEK